MYYNHNQHVRQTQIDPLDHSTDNVYAYHPYGGDYVYTHDIMLRGIEIPVPTHSPRIPCGDVRTMYRTAPAALLYS